MNEFERTEYDVCIIGAGVIGCAVAREASRFRLKIALLEKESDAAEGISKANRGVVHAGFNVRAGTLKARFNIDGLAYFPGICRDLDVPYHPCKKMVIAKDERERAQLMELYEQGLRNGSPGLSIIGRETIHNLEPFIQGEYALYSERTAVINPYRFTIALAENARANGAEIHLETEVADIRRGSAGGFLVDVKGSQSFSCKTVVNASGMFSDRVAAFLEIPEERVSPCRGEYLILDKDAATFVKMAVYPIPPSDGSGLGIHLTPTTEGNTLIGPSAEYLEARDDVGTTGEVMAQLKKEALDLLPELHDVPVIKSYAGIRPKLFNRSSGKSFADFVIRDSERHPGFINLIGIESPGLTSAPAIARHVVERLIGAHLPLVENRRFDPHRKGIVRTRDLPRAALARMVDQDREYGEIICRCEQVSRAEILAAVRNPLGARSLNAIKKRTHSMMGRCQSGYCLPRIAALLREEAGLKASAIAKNGRASAWFGEE